MKLEEYRGFFDTYSGKASEVGRQLAFAGIAVVWIFAVGKDGDKRIPSDLLVASIALVAFLAADFLQYASASLIWGVYYRCLERRYEDTDELPRHSTLLTWPQTIFFRSKVCLLLVAYVLMLLSLIHRFLD